MTYTQHIGLLLPEIYQADTSWTFVFSCPLFDFKEGYIKCSFLRHLPPPLSVSLSLSLSLHIAGYERSNQWEERERALSIESLVPDFLV
jgi:hypothetical protein